MEVKGNQHGRNQLVVVAAPMCTSPPALQHKPSHVAILPRGQRHTDEEAHDGRVLGRIAPPL